MARIRENGAVTDSQSRRIREQSMTAYVDGTAVRQLEAVPRRTQKRQQQPVSTATRKNRERALQMNLAYVIFLTAAAVVTIFMCVNYLQLQVRGTRLQKEVTVLETQLDSEILQNNSNYNRIMAGIDMEHVKDVAMNELGMGYATKSQIVTYQMNENDYVRQYSEVPEE